MVRRQLTIRYDGDRMRLVGKGDFAGDPLAGLGEFGRLARALDKGMRDSVRRCREAGCSWSEIGAALDISKQAAWERFAAEEGSTAE